MSFNDKVAALRDSLDVRALRVRLRATDGLRQHRRHVDKCAVPAMRACAIPCHISFARGAVDFDGRAAPLLRQNELPRSSANGAGLRGPHPPARVTVRDSAAVILARIASPPRR